jgi:hypothetical protein
MAHDMKTLNSLTMSQLGKETDSVLHDLFSGLRVHFTIAITDALVSVRRSDYK